MSDKFLTPKFRGSYCHLFKPQASKDVNGVPKYSITMVFPKDAPSTAEFMTKLKEAFKADMMADIKKVLPKEAQKHYPIKDGDTYTDEDGNPREEFAGCWVVKASNSKQPGIQVREEDGSRRDALSENEVYAGAFYHASIKTWFQNNEFGKGCRVSLSGVLKVEDGEAFGGNSFSDNEFDELDGKREAKKAAPAAEGDDL